MLFVIARLGGLLYAAALVVATVSGLPLWGAILLVGAVSVVYTTAGGISAVVWTDVLQFAMIFVGLAAGIWAAAVGVPGGLGQLWQAAGEGGRLTLFNPSWEPDSIRALPTALVAYGMLAFAVAGTNQQSVQRYVSCADEPSARKAILLGWFSGFVGVAATLLLGVLLFGFLPNQSRLAGRYRSGWDFALLYCEPGSCWGFRLFGSRYFCSGDVIHRLGLTFPGDLHDSRFLPALYPPSPPPRPVRCRWPRG